MLVLLPDYLYQVIWLVCNITRKVNNLKETVAQKLLFRNISQKSETTTGGVL